MMKNLNKLAFIGVSSMCLTMNAYAASPLWTFFPAPTNPPAISINSIETAFIDYVVTNQSSRAYTLRMKPITGITATYSQACTSALGPHASCVLTLAVDGSQLTGNVSGGPVLCNAANPNQCYQPSSADSLAISWSLHYPVLQTVAGANGSISPSGTQTLKPHASVTFTATPYSYYTVDQWLVDGVTVQEGGTSYTLTDITHDHVVEATFITLLRPSVSELGLSVNCTTAGGSCAQASDALTGLARTITFTNTTGETLSNVLFSSELPSGTTAASATTSTCDSSTGGTMAPGDTCTITVTPSQTASYVSGLASTPCTSGAQPDPSTNYIQVTSTEGYFAQVPTYVLGYGCIYQGGFIYDIDDSTSSTQSIGGKSLQVADFSNAPGASSMSVRGLPNWSGRETIIGQTDVGSSIQYASDQGDNNGALNTADIIAAFNTSASPPDLNNYAAGKCSLLSTEASGTTSCTAPNVCYSNWYLPAICDFLNAGFCTRSYSVASQLVTESIPTGLVANTYYWTSTGYDVPGALQALPYQISSASLLSGIPEYTKLGIRCARQLTTL